MGLPIKTTPEKPLGQSIESPYDNQNTRFNVFFRGKGSFL